jgi:methionyl-tRNA formyltransferase
MLLQRELDIHGKNAGQVTEELANLGAAALLDWLSHPTPPEPQPQSGAAYASKIDKAEARIDWSRSADEIGRQVRAFAPSPGAWFETKGERIKLLAAKIVEGSGAPGEVLDDRLTVMTNSAAIRPVQVQRASRGPMSAEELLRGFAVPKGTFLP